MRVQLYTSTGDTRGIATGVSQTRGAWRVTKLAETTDALKDTFLGSDTLRTYKVRPWAVDQE